jgi:hypothetical protein
MRGSRESHHSGYAGSYCEGGWSHEDDPFGHRTYGSSLRLVLKMGLRINGRAAPGPP